MTIEDEMKLEIKRLEQELSFLDSELEKLAEKMEKFIMIRKKKERDLSILKMNFGEASENKEIQTTLARLLKEI
jgi:hypothetical protein